MASGTCCFVQQFGNRAWYYLSETIKDNSYHVKPISFVFNSSAVKDICHSVTKCTRPLLTHEWRPLQTSSIRHLVHTLLDNWHEIDEWLMRYGIKDVTSREVGRTTTYRETSLKRLSSWLILIGCREQKINHINPPGN